MISGPEHNIMLKPAQWRAVEKKARHAGKSATEYVYALIQRDLLADKTFDEILAPIREDFRTTGMTQTKLDAIVRRARQSRRRKTRGNLP